MDFKSKLLQQPLPQLGQAIRCLVGELVHDELFPLLDPASAMAEQQLPLVAPILLHQCHALSLVLRALPQNITQELQDRAGDSARFPPELPNFLQHLLVPINPLDNDMASANDQQAPEQGVSLAGASNTAPVRPIARVFRKQRASERQHTEPGTAAAQDAMAATAAGVGKAAAAVNAASNSRPTTSGKEASPCGASGKRVVLGPGGNSPVEEQQSRTEKLQQALFHHKAKMVSGKGQLHVFRRTDSTSLVHSDFMISQLQELREANRELGEVVSQERAHLQSKICEAEDKAAEAESARNEAEKKALDAATDAQESRERAAAAETKALDMVARAEEAEGRTTMAETQARESLAKAQEAQKHADITEAKLRQMKVVEDEANNRASVAEDLTAAIRAELEQASMKISAHEHHVSQLLTTTSLLKEELEQVRAAAEKAMERAAMAEETLTKTAQPRSGFSACVVNSDALLLGVEAEENEAARGFITAEFGLELADAAARQTYRLGCVRLPAGPVSLLGGTGAATPVCASVTIANDGKAAWPATAVLALVDGAPFDLPLLQLGPVDPGDAAKLELDVSLPARAEAGTSRSSWVVSDAATGERFGPMLVLDVEWRASL